jgi:hypothetical protein
MKLVVFLSLVLVSACTNEKKETLKPQTRLEKFLLKFLDENKSYNQNNILRGRAEAKLKNDFYSEVPKGILKDFPLKFDEIREFQGQSYAHFSANVPYYDSPAQMSIGFDIIGVVGKKAIDTLDKNKLYTVEGNSPENLENSYRPYGTIFYDNRFTIENEYSNPKFSLGITKVNITGINKVDSKTDQ